MRRWLAPAVCALSLQWAGMARGTDQPYAMRLADNAAAWHAVLPRMQATAARAAADVIAGGQLYAFGPQPGFASEAGGRAGGLMLLRHYTPDTALTGHDTVLAAICEGDDDAELAALLAKARDAGAQVIVFGVTALPGAEAFSVQTAPDLAQPVSTESMSHVIGMWAWTGQFIAACVERGQMPCVYQSYLLPGGRERAAYLKQHGGGRFHEATAVQAGDAAKIAPAFLDAIVQALRQTWQDNRAGFERGGALLQAARAAGRPVAVCWQGHLFPAELEQPARPDWFTMLKAGDPPPDGLAGAIVLEYQATPWETLAKLGELKVAVIWTCAQPPAADLTALPDHVYLDPHWPTTDAVVDLPGYDVPVLPASGVLDAAVYWQLVELATR